MSAVSEIIQNDPSSINTYPTLASRWWQSAMNQRSMYPLNEACSTGNTEIIELLLLSGADVNCNDGLTPLSVTFTGKLDNWYEISCLLIEKGASLDYTTEYSGGHSSILCDIVNSKARPEEAGNVSEDDENVVLAFSYALGIIDQINVDWPSVLQYSVSNDRLEIVRLLLDEGYCDVNVASVGMTPLMFAARDASPEMVELLLSYGANRNAVSDDGMTALDYAKQFNNNVAEALLEF